MTKKFNTKDLARVAIVASMYIAISLAISPLTFGAVQFRFSELLMLFVFYNRKYAISLILGCFVVNIFSPLGIVDMFIGTGATVIACLLMMPIRNIWIASLMPTLSCVIISAELFFLTGAPFWLTTLTVLVGEFVVVTIIGCPLMKLITRNKQLIALLGFNRNLSKTVNSSEPPSYNGKAKSSHQVDTQADTQADNQVDTKRE